jgi:uncharacterized protein YqhQ
VSDNGVETIKYTHIGGQAVIEGVMMRGKYNWAVAVRTPDESIHIEQHDLKTSATKNPWLGKPIIRGVIGLYETLVLAMKAFAVSASLAGETEEEQLSSKEIGFTMILGLFLAIGLFIVLPTFATNFLLGAATERPFAWNLLHGIFVVALFFLYIWGVSRMRDIQRVFAYHGAEHKTIHAYEHGLPLEADVIQRYETMHVRCGTSFLLMVMVISIIVFTLVPVRLIAQWLGMDQQWQITLMAIGMRIVLLPLIAGLAYEVIKWAGKAPDKPLVRVLLWPGLQLQKMTTREPSDDMVEVAVAAMKEVVAREDAERDGSAAASGTAGDTSEDTPASEGSNAASVADGTA